MTVPSTTIIYADMDCRADQVLRHMGENLPAMAAAGPIIVIMANATERAKIAQECLASNMNHVTVKDWRLVDRSFENKVWPIAQSCGAIMSHHVDEQIGKTRFKWQHRDILIQSLGDDLANIVNRPLQAAFTLLTVVRNSDAGSRIDIISGRRQRALPLTQHLALAFPYLDFEHFCVKDKALNSGAKPASAFDPLTNAALAKDDRILPNISDGTRQVIVTSLQTRLYGAALFPWLKSSQHDASYVINTADNPANLAPISAQLHSDNIRFGIMRRPANRFLTAQKISLFEKIAASFAKPDLLFEQGNTPEIEPALWHYAAAHGSGALVVSVDYISRLIKEADTLFAKFDGVVCVAPGRILVNRVLVSVAKIHSVPTVEIQVATITKAAAFLRPLADYVFAQDPLAAALMHQHMGVREEQVVLTGSPKTDGVVEKYGQVSRFDARQKIGADPNHKRLCFPSQPFADDVWIEIIGFLQRLAKRTGTQIDIVLHPNERFAAKSRSKLLEKLSDNNALNLVVDGDIFDYVAASDAVVIYNSGTGFEAAALGRPVVAMNMPDIVRDLDLVGTAHIRGFDDVESMARYLRPFLNKRWWRFWRRVPAPPFWLDGKAGDRIDRYLKQIMPTKKLGWGPARFQTAEQSDQE